VELYRHSSVSPCMLAVRPVTVNALQTADVVPLCSWQSSWWPRADFTLVRAPCGDIRSSTWPMCVGVRVSGWYRDSAKARGIRCRPSFFISFPRPPSPYCAHTHIYLTPYSLHTNYRCYQITLQRNIFTQIGAVRSVDWVFIVGAPVWR
jgi:hypothetical protein